MATGVTPMAESTTREDKESLRKRYLRKAWAEVSRGGSERRENYEL